MSAALPGSSEPVSRQAERPRTVEGGHAQHTRAAGKRGGVAGHALAQQGGGAQFAEQVEIVVAGRAVGADARY
jgi:hypothetical protein